MLITAYSSFWKCQKSLSSIILRSFIPLVFISNFITSAPKIKKKGKKYCYTCISCSYPIDIATISHWTSYKMLLSIQYNCWSLRCSCSIACWRCSNYIFILDLTPGCNGLGRGNWKSRWGSFKFWNLVPLISRILQNNSLIGHWDMLLSLLSTFKHDLMVNILHKLSVKLQWDGCEMIMFNDKSTFAAQVMVWCCQAASHHLSQCWPRMLLLYNTRAPSQYKDRLIYVWRFPC